MMIPRRHAQLVGELLDEIARIDEHLDEREALRRLIRGAIEMDARKEALERIRPTGRRPRRRGSDE